MCLMKVYSQNKREVLKMIKSAKAHIPLIELLVISFRQEVQTLIDN